jgi:hypothetical protein
MKLDLLTNATVVEDVIRFVSSQKSKENKESTNSNDEDDKDQLEEGPEENTGEVITNQVF